tara:strand:- start:23 stop:214 length:192 start_codon:yes stop_codon:yes gene_type:complete
MIDLVVGIGMAFFIEGVLYALVPNFMKKMMAIAVLQKVSTLRLGGILVAFFGLLFVSVARGYI